MASVDPDQMIRALALGMFPMAPTRSSDSVDWINPKTRGVLPLDRFHVQSNVKRHLRTNRFLVSTNEAFPEILAMCAEKTPERTETWINESIRAACIQLHERGLAHSIECWRGDTLVGGLFGISLGGLFSIESMFSRISDTSKVATACLMVRLRVGGYRLVDCQFISKHLVSLGAVQVDRPSYLRLLEEALIAGGIRPASPLAPAQPTEVDFFALDRLAAADASHLTARGISSRWIASLLDDAKQPFCA